MGNNSWRNRKDHARKILPPVHKFKEILLFDTETTGLGKMAKIIQFSGIHYAVKAGYQLEELAKIDLYINPEEPLEDKITEITGITDAMLKDAPTEGEAAPEVFAFLNRCGLWAAYNCAFDLRMLDQMSSRLDFLYKPHPCLDILDMSRDFVDREESGTLKLGDVLAYLYPEEQFQFHSAIEDVRATARLLSAFLPRYRGEFDSMAGPKRQLKLEWAKPWQNPHAPSQQRIRLKLNEGSFGDIYWDIVGHAWKCKATREAKTLFRDIDIANLEQQLLNRYGWKYSVRDMAALAKAWMSDIRKAAKTA